jgi:hypothetical protein
MYKVKDICICFICKEDLSKRNIYTNLAKKNIEFWNNKYPTHPLFILTNNPEEFCNLDCTTILDQNYFSQFNKFDLIDVLEKKFDTVIYLDCDNLLGDLSLDIEDIEPGIHVSRNWESDWGTLKKLEYFKVWNQHINIEDNIHFPAESVIILKRHENWKKTYDRICYLREISNITEKLSNTPDENPHHGPERCESIALYESCTYHKMPIYLNSKYATQFYDAIIHCNNY